MNDSFLSPDGMNDSFMTSGRHPPGRAQAAVLHACGSLLTAAAYRPRTTGVDHPSGRITAWFDGGGKLRTADRPVRGRAEVTRAVLALLAPRPGTHVDERSVNGSAGLVVRVDDRVAAVVLWRARDRVIADLRLVLDPAELRGWPVVTNERAVLS